MVMGGLKIEGWLYDHPRIESILNKCYIASEILLQNHDLLRIKTILASAIVMIIPV